MVSKELKEKYRDIKYNAEIRKINNKLNWIIGMIIAYVVLSALAVFLNTWF